MRSKETIEAFGEEMTDPEVKRGANVVTCDRCDAVGVFARDAEAERHLQCWHSFVARHDESGCQGRLIIPTEMQRNMENLIK